jgi:hypothetical protein
MNQIGTTVLCLNPIPNGLYDPSLLYAILGFNMCMEINIIKKSSIDEDILFCLIIF